MVDQTAFYLTTPIYYVNDVPHIGHAYTTVAGDVLTRWHRQRQEKVHFLTGTDEHGQKVLRSAQANGVAPQQWCDDLVAREWKPVLHTIDAANDDFIRTTEPRHIAKVQQFLAGLYDKGEIYQGSYTGPYCVSCEEFKLPGDLDELGNCRVHDRQVDQISETNYFFPLSRYSERLLAHYEEHPEAVQPASARHEVLSFIRSGLQDLSISRSSFDWGIKVPWDEGQVVYVWVDALLNYWTALGEDPDHLWPADVHLVGKDILRFHAVIWPAMLMAAGLELPRTVFAHGWLLVGGEKMSKTRLTGIHPSQIVDHFGSDAFRYYFLREIAFGHDGAFSWESMAARYTSELANDFGNLASRVAAMVIKFFDGILPAGGQATEADRGLSELLARTATDADSRMLALDFQGGLDAIFSFVKAVNGYLTEQQPWKVAKHAEQRERLGSILYTAAESLRALAVLLNPVMPKSSAALWDSLGAQPGLGPLAQQRLQDAGAWGQLPAGSAVTKGAVLFPRLEDPAEP